MRRVASIPLILLLAIGVHVDWHLARPLHHRLSLAWQHHWIFAALFFSAAACVIAFRWPRAAQWRTAGWILLWGLVGAQLVEPVLTLAYYEHRLGYEVEPERWEAFFECLAAGLPAYVATLWCVRFRLMIGE